MNEILKAIQQLEGRMIDQFDQVDQRFEHINERLNKIDQKLGQFDERLNKSTENNDTMIGKLDQIKVKLDRMESTLNTLANTFNEGTVAILNRIDKNTISFSRDTEFLSGKVGKHEMYFHRINEK